METVITGLRVVVSLAAVLGLLWVIQRKVAKSGRVTRQAKHVTVVARQGLSGKASLTVVDIEGVRYVLGVTEHAVNVLSSGVTPQDARVTAIAPVTTVAPSAGIAGTADAEAPSFAAAMSEAQVVDLPLERTGSRHSALPELGPRRANRAVALTPPYRRGRSTGQPAQSSSPVAGSILSAATWKQAAAAMRSQKRA